MLSNLEYSLPVTKHQAPTDSNKVKKQQIAETLAKISTQIIEINSKYRSFLTISSDSISPSTGHSLEYYRLLARCLEVKLKIMERKLEGICFHTFSCALTSF